MPMLQYNLTAAYGPNTDVLIDRHMQTDINRKVGNDQESIQLPNTFRSKTPKGKKGELKVTALQSKHYKQTAKKTVSAPKMAKRLSKINLSPGHTMT